MPVTIAVELVGSTAVSVTTVGAAALGGVASGGVLLVVVCVSEGVLVATVPAGEPFILLIRKYPPPKTMTAMMIPMMMFLFIIVY